MPEDDRDPEATLDEWKEKLQAEHDAAIHDPDPDAEHRIEAVQQVPYRLTYEYDPERDALRRVGAEQVEDLSDPDLRSCACGVRGMTAEEAREHVRTARERGDS